MYMNTWAIHCRYRKVLDMSAEMCGRESPWNLYWRSDKSTRWGLFLLRHGGPSRIGLPPLGVQGATRPPIHTHKHTLSRLAPAGPARSTPPRTHLWSEGCFVGRVRPGRESPPLSNQLSESKRSSVSSQPLSIFLSAFVYTETTTKSWTVSEDGEEAGEPPDTAQVRASQVLVCAYQSQQFFCVASIVCSPDASTFAKAFEGVFPQRLRIS